MSSLIWGGIVPLCDITKGCLPDLFVLTKVENAKEANDELIPGEFADRLVRKHRFGGGSVKHTQILEAEDASCSWMVNKLII